MKYLLVVMSFFFCTLSQAFIYVATAQEKRDSEGMRHQLSGLGDEHTNHAVDPTQRKDFFEYMRTLDPAETCIIIEDMCWYEGDNTIIQRIVQRCRAMGKKMGMLFLDGLGEECKKLGFHVINVECRYIGLASTLAPIEFTKYNLNPIQVTAQQVLAYNDTLVKEISTYADGPLLGAYYTDTLKTLQEKEKQVRQIIAKDPQWATKSFMQLGRSRFLTPEDKQALPGLLYSAQVEIIDMRIMHAIYSNQDKKYIFVVAGGNHIQRTMLTASMQQLANLGYENYYTVPENRSGSMHTPISLGQFFAAIAR